MVLREWRGSTRSLPIKVRESICLLRMLVPCFKGRVRILSTMNIWICPQIYEQASADTPPPKKKAVFIINAEMQL